MKHLTIIHESSHILLSTELYAAMQKKDSAQVDALVKNQPNLLQLPVAYAYGLPIYAISAAIQMDDMALVDWLLEKITWDEPPSVILKERQMAVPLEYAIHAEKNVALIEKLLKAHTQYSTLTLDNSVLCFLNYSLDAPRLDCLLLLLNNPSYRQVIFTHSLLFQRFLVRILSLDGLEPLTPFLSELPNKQWLKEYPDPNMHILRIAVQKKLIKVVEQLLDLGMSPSDGEEIITDFSAPFLAIHHHANDILALLLERGADRQQIFKIDNALVTLHTFAILKRNNDAMRILISSSNTSLRVPTGNLPPIIQPMSASIESNNEQAMIWFLPDALQGNYFYFGTPQSARPAGKQNHVHFIFHAISRHLHLLLEETLTHPIAQQYFTEESIPFRQMFLACCHYANETAWLNICRIFGEARCEEGLTKQAFEYALHILETVSTMEQRPITTRLILRLFSRFADDINPQFGALTQSLSLYQAHKALVLNYPDEKKNSIFAELLTSACLQGSWPVIDDILKTMPTLKSQFSRDFAFMLKSLIPMLHDSALFKSFLDQSLIQCNPNIGLLILLAFFTHQPDTEVALPPTALRFNPRFTFTSQSNDCAILFLSQLHSQTTLAEMVKQRPLPSLVEVSLKGTFLAALAANNLDGIQKLHDFLIVNQWFTFEDWNNRYIPLFVLAALQYENLAVINLIAPDISPTISFIPNDLLNDNHCVFSNTQRLSLWDIIENKLFACCNGANETSFEHLNLTTFKIALILYQSNLSSSEKTFARKMIIRCMQSFPFLVAYCLETFPKILSGLITHFDRPVEYLRLFLQNNTDITFSKIHADLLKLLVVSKFKLQELLLDTMAHSMVGAFYYVATCMHQNNVKLSEQDQKITPFGLLTKQFWTESDPESIKRYWFFSHIILQLFGHSAHSKVTLQHIAQLIAQEPYLPRNPSIDAPFMHDPLQELIDAQFPVEHLFQLAVMHSNQALLEQLLLSNHALILTPNLIAATLNLGDTAFAAYYFAQLDDEDLETILVRSFVQKSFDHTLSLLTRMQNRLNQIFPIDQFSFLHLACLLSNTNLLRFAIKLLPKAPQAIIDAPIHLSRNTQEHLIVLEQCRFLHLPTQLQKLDWLDGLTAFDLNVILNQTVNAELLAPFHPNITNIESNRVQSPLFQGHSLLNIAVTRNNLQLAKLLLKLNSDPIFAGTHSKTNCLSLCRDTHIQTLIKTALRNNKLEHSLAHIDESSYFPEEFATILAEKKAFLRTKLEQCTQTHKTILNAQRLQTNIADAINTIESVFLTIRPEGNRSDLKLAAHQSQVQRDIKSFRKLKTLQFSPEWDAAIAQIVQALERFAQHPETLSFAGQIRELHQIDCMTYFSIEKILEEQDLLIELSNMIEDKVTTLKNSHKTLKCWLRATDLMPENPNAAPPVSTSTSTNIGFFNAAPDFAELVGSGSRLLIYLQAPSTVANGRSQ